MSEAYEIARIAIELRRDAETYHGEGVPNVEEFIQPAIQLIDEAYEEGRKLYAGRPQQFGSPKQS